MKNTDANPFSNPPREGQQKGQLVIISVILSYAAKGVGKTELMYKVGLSSAQLDKYIPSLVRLELLEVSNHTKRALYKTTNKSRSFLDIFDTLVKLLD
jgi:predicted transcriptional regulator